MTILRQNVHRAFRQRWLGVGLLAGALAFGELALAEQIEISSTLNPVGSGARAMGMGGAFIGVADDATAASWNPAGLVQLERPEVSAVNSAFVREQTYASLLHPEINGDHTMAADGLNYASIAYPCQWWGHNLTVSLNYQRLYELNKSVNLTYTYASEQGEREESFLRFRQKGYLHALSPAMAVRLTPALSVGTTVNLWTDSAGRNGWQTTEELTLPTDTYVHRLHTDSRYAFEGVNMNVGFLWTVHGPFTLGGVYKSGFDATLSQETTTFESLDWRSLGEHYDTLGTTEDEQTLRMPASYGLGLAYRYSDSLTFGLDLYRTEWSRFVRRDDHGVETNPLDGSPAEANGLADTTQLRLGTEYLIIRDTYVVPVRFGVFSDPEPKSGGVDRHYGVSCGSGYLRGSVALDLAYQFRQGLNGGGDIPSLRDNRMDVNQQTLMMSVIYYF